MYDYADLLADYARHITERDEHLRLEFEAMLADSTKPGLTVSTALEEENSAFTFVSAIWFNPNIKRGEIHFVAPFAKTYVFRVEVPE